MASISYNKRTGLKRILFAYPERKRRILYLGEATARTAENIKTNLQRLIEAKISNTSLHSETAA
jgi:hypothetical protein